MEYGQDPLVIFSFGRLGDIVACEPLYRRLHKINPQRPVWFYCRPAYYDAVRFTPYFDRCATFADKAEFEKIKASLPPESLVYEFCNHISLKDVCDLRRYYTESYHLLNWSEDEAGLSLTDESAHFYLDPEIQSPIPLPEHFVVFCCQSLAKSRQWPICRWRKLAQYFIKKGIHVIECGIAPTLKLNSPYYHTVPFGTIQATAKIISRADAAVGVESGLMHIANAFGIFGFVLSGMRRNDKEYNHYNGGYREGKNCNILRLYGRLPFHLQLAPVTIAIDAFLKGEPMTRQQCDLFMLKYQIEEYQKKWYVRFFGAPLDWIYRIWMAIQFHHRPKMPKKH